MNHSSTHPVPQKVQVDFHQTIRQDTKLEDPRDVKKTVTLINKKSDLTNPQNNLRMKEEPVTGDLHREFEIKYEQFLINIHEAS